MAERIADLVAQIESVRQLDSVVTAMRGIAASRAQKGRSLLPGVEAYAEVVSRAIGQALSLLPADGMAAPADGAARRGLVLFCAEQGFAGAFSERVLDAAADDLRGATVFLLGTRGAVLAGERGLEPAWRAAMATHVEAVPDLANRLADALYARVGSDGLARVDILFSRTGAEGGIEVDRHSLLPVDFSRFARPVGRRVPLINLPARSAGRAAGGRIHLRPALPGRPARLRGRERGAHAGDGRGPHQHRDQARRPRPARTPVAPGGDHGGDPRACDGGADFGARRRQGAHALGANFDSAARRHRQACVFRTSNVNSRMP